MSAHAFKAATWNVYHGTPRKEAEPILTGLLEDNVSIILGQEFSDPQLRDMLRDAGLRLSFHPRQYLVAWNPDLWVGVAKEGVRLGSTAYYRKGGDNRQWSEAASAILCDRVGRSLDVLSYHTPAGVQRGGPSAAVPRRVQALRESMATLGERAKAAQTRAVLYGGDDNVDEDYGAGWAFMLRAATGLRQVQAPASTHGSRKPGKGRQIDDFRVKGLKVGHGSVREGGGDHRIHVRTFRWA